MPPVGSENIFGEKTNVLDRYSGGDKEAAIALSGQVAGRNDEAMPASPILAETMAEFHATIAQLNKRYGG